MADGKETKTESSNSAVDTVYEMLKTAAKPDGPQALTATTKLKPAGGFERLVAPARYSFDEKDPRKGSTYVFERRFLPGEDNEGGRAVTTVLLDSRESNANRLEEAIRMAAESGGHVFSKMPTIEVAYGKSSDAKDGDAEGGDAESFRDYDLPHRAFDAHIRLAEFKDLETYKKARKATPRNARALFDISPITVLLGGWDSTGGCAKFPALIVGETFGVLADQSSRPEDTVRRRHGARLDPVSPSFMLTGKDLEGELDSTAEEDRIDDVLKKQKASELNLGHIAPTYDEGKDVDGVAVSSIVRHNVLQFGALRRLHFGSRDDAAIRTLLAAMAIDAMVRANGELFLRANAQLVLAEPAPNWIVDEVDGSEAFYVPLSIEEADSLLETAYDAAADADAVNWKAGGAGNLIKVMGNKKIYNSRKIEEEDDAKETKES